jgi:hypothetical protein
MKTILFALCFLCATAAAVGQAAGSLSNVAQPTQIPSHPEHAMQHSMGQEQNLLEHSDYSYAQGERPLWEFGPVSRPVPLGDTARMLRKEHATAKKSEVIWVN